MRLEFLRRRGFVDDKVMDTLMRWQVAKWQEQKCPR
jgi:hypothetical protein